MKYVKIFLPDSIYESEDVAGSFERIFPAADKVIVGSKAVFVGFSSTRAAKRVAHSWSGHRWKTMVQQAASAHGVLLPKMSTGKVRAIVVEDLGVAAAAAGAAPPGPSSPRVEHQRARRSSTAAAARTSREKDKKSASAAAAAAVAATAGSSELVRGRSVSDADLGSEVAQSAVRRWRSSHLQSEAELPYSSRKPDSYDQFKPPTENPNSDGLGRRFVRRSVSLSVALSDDFFHDYMMRRAASNFLTWALLPLPALIAVFQCAGGVLPAATVFGLVNKHWHQVAMNNVLWRLELDSEYALLDRHGRRRHNRGQINVDPALGAAAAAATRERRGSSTSSTTSDVAVVSPTMARRRSKPADRSADTNTFYQYDSSSDSGNDNDTGVRPRSVSATMAKATTPQTRVRRRPYKEPSTTRTTRESRTSSAPPPQLWRTFSPPSLNISSGSGSASATPTTTTTSTAAAAAAGGVPRSRSSSVGAITATSKNRATGAVSAMTPSDEQQQQLSMSTGAAAAAAAAAANLPDIDEAECVTVQQQLENRHLRLVYRQALLDAWLDGDNSGGGGDGGGGPVQRSRVSGEKHSELITCVHVRDGICVTASKDCFLRVVDLGLRGPCSVVRRFDLGPCRPNRQSPVHDIAFLPKAPSECLATSDALGNVFLFNAAAGIPVQSAPGSPQQVASPVTSPNTRRRAFAGTGRVNSNRSDSSNSSTTSSAPSQRSHQQRHHHTYVGVGGGGDDDDVDVAASGPLLIQLPDSDSRRLFMSREGPNTLLFGWQSSRVVNSVAAVPTVSTSFRSRGTALSGGPDPHQFFAASASSGTVMGSFAAAAAAVASAGSPLNAATVVAPGPPQPPPLDYVRLWRVPSRPFDAGDDVDEAVPLLAKYGFAGRLLCCRRVPLADNGLVVGLANSDVVLMDMETGGQVTRLNHSSQHYTSDPGVWFDAPAACMEFDVFGRLLVGGACDLAAYDFRMAPDAQRDPIVSSLDQLTEQAPRLQPNGLVQTRLHRLQQQQQQQQQHQQHRYDQLEPAAMLAQPELSSGGGGRPFHVQSFSGHRRTIGMISTVGSLVLTVSPAGEALVYDVRRTPARLHTLDNERHTIAGVRVVGGRVAVLSSYGFGGCAAFDLVSGRRLFSIRDQFLVSAGADDRALVMGVADPTAGADQLAVYSFSDRQPPVFDDDQLTTDLSLSKRCLIS